MTLRSAIFNEAATGTTLSAAILDTGNAIVYVGPNAHTVGDIIAIEDEWMIVGAVVTATKTLTVRRGKWTTAAPHAAGTSIKVVNPVAQRSIPDAALPRLLAVFGDAQTGLDWQWNKTKLYVLEQSVEAARATGQAQVDADTTAERDAVNAEWPA